MDGHEQIDREIASMLDVEPSPEFLARVRARVAEEPAPGGWHRSWMLAAAAVAAIIVAVIAWPSPKVTPPIESPRIAEAAPAIAPPQPTPRAAQGRPTAVRAVAATVERVRRIDIDLPEVVIADNEVKTFAALVANVRQSRFDVPVKAAPNLEGPIEVKELPSVEPIEIEPIVKVAVLQAEGERP